MTEGRLIARNSALNIVGHAVPVMLAVLAIPPLVRGLGAERFGVLTLVWAAIGYFSLFELGLSRALTQAIAHRLGNGGTDELPALSWTALLLLFVFGVVGAIVLAAVTPVLVFRVLNISTGLRTEATTAFYILALSLPFVVTSVGLRGIMEAHQHFGAVTALRIPVVALMFLGPLAVLPFSRSLVPAVALLALGRALAWAAHLVYCLRRYQFLRGGVIFARAPIKPLLHFGGWTTVSNVVSPVMVVLDRFFIGALLTMAAVAHYVTPYEVVVKLLIVPTAILGAMFPAFAASFASDRERMARLYQRSLRAVVVIMFPIVLVAIALANEGLMLWVGPMLPRESASVLQWLAAGVFLNSIAQPPYSALQGAGRPDLIAKLHLVELPFYVIGLWLLVRAFGLSGAAMAWTFRVALDAVALLLVASRRLGLPTIMKTTTTWPVAIMLAAFVAAALLTTPLARVAYVTAALVVFAPIVWRAMLTGTERDGLRAWWQNPLGRTANDTRSGEGVA